MKTARIITASLLVSLSLTMHGEVATDTRKEQVEICRAYPIASINQEAVDTHHQSLVAEFKLNTLARYGLKSVAGLLVIYGAYQVWLSHKEHNAAHEHAPVVPRIALVRDLSEEVDRLNAHVDAMHSQLYALNPKWFSWQWIKNGATSIGWSVFNIAMAKGIFDRGEQLVDSVFHTGNLDWYVKTHTRSIETLVELTEYAHNLDVVGVSAREHAHHKEQVMHATTGFITHMTAVLGFMSYSKSVVLDPQVRLQMHNLMEYFRVTCNDFAVSVTYALEHNQSVTPHISKMSVELNRLLMSFMRLEYEQTLA